MNIDPTKLDFHFQRPLAYAFVEFTTNKINKLRLIVEDSKLYEVVFEFIPGNNIQ